MNMRSTIETERCGFHIMYIRNTKIVMGLNPVSDRIVSDNTPAMQASKHD